MVSEETLKHQFQTLSINVEDKAILGKCLDLCDLYNVSEEVLVEMWVAFVLDKNDGTEPTLSTLGQMERAVLQKQNKSALDVRAKTNSPTRSIQSRRISKDNDHSEDILEMYGYKGPQVQQVKRLRSPGEPPGVSVTQESKIRALETSFSPASYTKKSETPRRILRTESRGCVKEKFGGDVVDWKTTNPWQVPVGKTDDPHVPPRPLYMFDLLSKKSSICERRCREFGESFSKIWNKETHPETPAITLNVAMQSQTKFRTWGRICDSSSSSTTLNPLSIMLEGCKAKPLNRLPCVIQIDTSALKSYSLFPGQIVAVEGKNPTGKKLMISRLFDSGYPPPSPKPKLQENMHIFVAAGPFTPSKNLDYESLFELMECVVEKEPHVLILIGPFLPDYHEEIRNATICDTYQQLFEKLVEKVMKSVEGKCTQVVLIPSSHDIQHDPVYPTPQYFLPESMQSPNLHLMPDPCMLDLEGLVIGATSVDSIQHLYSKGIHRNLSKEERLSQQSSHILSQACFYPLYPPSEKVNLDTGLWDKYAFMYHQPHILILPSSLQYFCEWKQDCFVINPGRLTTRMYARMIVKPSFDQPWTKQHINCEIFKL